jgi:hypothetical protein
VVEGQGRLVLEGAITAALGQLILEVEVVAALGTKDLVSVALVVLGWLL